MRKFRLALTVSALAATFIAYAIPVTVTETNTIDQIEFLTYWTYDIDLSSTPATATLLKLEDASGDVTIRNLIAVNGKLCTVNKIGEGAIANNPSLLSCTIPNTILEIGAYAFSNCTALAEITLDYGIRYIGERAFVNTIVREIKVPDSLLDMGGNILAGTLFTSTINIEDSSHFKYSDDGALYNRDMTKLYACPTRAEGTITIPNTVTNIATDAFFGCHRLSYLNIPATVNTIGSGAFNVAGIWPGLSAPEATPKLKTIFFNGPPPEAAGDIFNGAPENLVIYALSDEWTGVSTWKGRPVQVIDSVNPPVLSYTDDTTGITWYYRIVNGMAEIFNDGKAAISPKSTPGRPFMLTEESQDWSALWVLQIPKSINGYVVTKIGDHAFDGCNNLTRIGIPSSVESIGKYAFKGCYAIKAISDDQGIMLAEDISLPVGVASLGYHLFEGLKVASISMPYTLSETDGNPVAGCAYVTSLSVDSSCPSFYSEGNILYNKRKNTVVAVPANYDGASVSFLNSVTTIGDEALFGCKNVSNIQVPEALEAIGARAFAECESIKSLALPDTLATIGDAAFSNCLALTKVTYAGNAPDAADDIYEGTPETLASYVYDTASGFTTDNWQNRNVVVVSTGDGPKAARDEELSQTIGKITWYFRVVDGVAEIWRNGATAVTSTDPIMSLSLPTTLGGCIVKGIGDGALSNLRGIGDVSVPGSYEWIGDYAFSNCTVMASISIGYGVRHIGARVFMNTIIREIALPDSVIEMGGNISAGTLFTSSINIQDSSHFVYDVNGAIYNKDKTKLYACPTRAESVISLPDTVTNICQDAFFGCHRLTRIYVPQSLTTIGTGAFNVAGIWPDLSAPESYPHLVAVVFDGVLPDAADDIYDGAPADLVSYGKGSTWSGLEEWKGRLVSNDDPSPALLSETENGITWYYRIVDGVAEIFRDGKTAVTAETPINGIALPDALGGRHVKGIGVGALSNLRGITSISIPDTYESIGSYAFSNCTSLASITIPYGVRYIGERAFVNTIITEINVPDSLLDMGGNISAGTLFTSSISISDSSHFKYSEDGVLYNRDMTKLYACPTRAEGTITIPNTVTDIAMDAFFGCHRLTELEFSAALNTIESGAFNVAGIWPGLSAPESTPKLKSVLFKGAPPEASDNIFDGSPDDLVIYAATDEWKGLSEWKGRPVSTSDTPVYDSSESIDGIIWNYHIKNGKAVITGASGEAETVTVPAMLGGYAVSAINADALDGLSGVKAYKSESDLYKTKNGCLYSADGKTLIRVPDSLVLPYSVTTEVSSKIVTVTIVPGLKDSGNPGNDGTSITTNITSSSSSRTTKKIDGDISFDALLSGVTTIADHAFYGCNSNLTNDYTSTSENLSGETGFIGTSGDAYVRTSTKVTSTNSTYETTFTLPATVKTVGANAFEGSGVVSSRNTTPQTPTDNSSRRQELTDTRQLAESSRYIGWIEQSGKIVGTVAVKTGKARNGVIKTSGSVVKIGAKKTKIKSMSELSAIDGLTLVKDLSASKSDATAFNAFKGKCWTVALMTSDSSAPLLDGYTTLSIAIQAKGKVRITGNTADGTKISASAQMVVDGDTFKIPVAAQLYSGKRGGFATVLTVAEDGGLSIDGGVVAFTAILNGAPVHISLLTIDSAPRGNALSGDISIWGAGNDEYSLAENLGWKPRYTKSSGQFKGSVSLINNSNGKRVRSTVTGVVVDGIGYGTAVVKGVRSWKVEVK